MHSTYSLNLVDFLQLLGFQSFTTCILYFILKLQNLKKGGKNDSISLLSVLNQNDPRAFFIFFFIFFPLTSRIFVTWKSFSSEPITLTFHSILPNISNEKSTIEWWKTNPVFLEKICFWIIIWDQIIVLSMAGYIRFHVLRHTILWPKIN